MTTSFDEAQRRYDELKQQHEAGELAEMAYRRAIAEIRVKDESGTNWRIEPGQGWLYWDGARWMRQLAVGKSPSPPLEKAESPRAPETPETPETPQVSSQDVQRKVRQGWKWLRIASGVFQGRLPPPQVFIQQAKKVPLRQRSQPWWDALAIMGGAAAGLLWFLYTSVRGMPHVSFFGLSYQSYFDFLPPAAIAVVVVLLFMARRKVMAVLSRVLGPLRRVPLIGRLGLGGIVLVGGMFLRYRSGFFQGREGLDLITPLIMFFLPVTIVFLRRPIDVVLLPFDPIRRKVPKLVLIGLGLAVPYVVAYVLYNWAGMIQYPFLRASVMFGTLISYAIVRTPQRPQVARVAASKAADPVRPTSGQRREMARLRLARLALGYVVLVSLLWVTPAFADDFFRDPFNANDGLRTPGVATAMAGTATVVVVALVNGAEVVRTVIQGPVKEEDEGKRKTFEIRINSVDVAGATAVGLQAGVCQQIFIYAACYEIGKGAFPAGDATLTFTQAGAEAFVSLTDLGQAHAQRCASVELIETSPEGLEPPSELTVNVSAGAGGELMTIPVVLTLELPRYILRFH